MRPLSPERSAFQRFFGACGVASVALLASACGSLLGRAERAPAAPDFRLSLVWERDGGARSEVYVLSGAQSRGLCRLRRSAGGSWPRVFEETFAGRVEDPELGRLAVELERSGFFGLRSALGSEGEALVLRATLHGRVHQVVARGRSEPELDRAVRAVLAALPVDPGPLPGWLGGTDAGGGDRPKLVPDLAGALRFHEAWLAAEPERRALHLDLFALHLRAGDERAAAREVEALRADRDLIGLVPELRALLK